jgi:threonylcarbamoyladenosine tRNA methylthiotransferase MtaB
MLTFLIHTLGCKVNQLESEAITDAFIQAGFVLQTSNPSLIIVNTCTVTSKADQKARRVIRKALRDYPLSCVIVTGCYAQLDRRKLEKLDKSGRLFVVKGMKKEKIINLPRFINENHDIPGALKSWQEEQITIDNEQKTDDISAFQFSPQEFSGHTRSFLKIQDGCDKNCAYCRIRLARGKSVSLASGIVMERLKILEKTHAEAVLTGVNICQYRDSVCGNLRELLEYLISETERISLRLSSLAPESVDESFAEILSHKRIRPHFHLSIQSGSEKVLERMGRNYDASVIENAVLLLRRAKDDPFLACDIIAGFPGESEEEFEKTYALCKKLEFAWIHVFPYSKRPGTPAFSYTDTVQESEVTRRVKLLTDLAFLGKKEYARRWFGREVDVLVEQGAVSGAPGMTVCCGTSENYLKVRVRYEGEKPLPGTVLRCVLTEQGGVTEDFDAAANTVTHNDISLK